MTGPLRTAAGVKTSEPGLHVLDDVEADEEAGDQYAGADSQQLQTHGVAT